MIDLHTHSVHSDGTWGPRKLVWRAARKKLSAFAIADHDTVDGLPIAMRYTKKHRVTFLPAVELTVDFYYGHIHILGYGIDFKNPQLLVALQKRKEGRVKQFYHKVAYANGRLGKKGIIDAEALLKEMVGTPTRGHIVTEILHNGWAGSFKEAFDLYLAGYESKESAFAPDEAISLVKKVGGVAVLAHPGHKGIGLRRFAVRREDEIVAITELKELGLAGIEVYTPAHAADQIPHYLQIAENLGLIVTGGTDWHGPNLGSPGPGDYHIPDSVWEKIKSRFKL